jgi:transposase-like protein
MYQWRHYVRQIDEVFLTINGAQHYLWLAVDQDGYVLDILVQSRRNKHAAKKFFRLSHPDRPSASSPPMVPLPNTSARDGICCQPPHTVKK